MRAQSSIFLRLKPLVFILCLVPLAQLIYGAVQNTLGVNPVETLTRTTGDWALYFLLMTLAVTPLRRYFPNLSWLMRYRRMLGLYAFFYACVHVLTYVWFDQFFDVNEILRDILKRPFITLGMLSFVLLIPLAVTSTQAMMRRLKQKWGRLHRLIYPISVLVMIHYFMMIKADYKEFLIFACVLGLLLGSRLITGYSHSKKM